MLILRKAYCFYVSLKMHCFILFTNLFTCYIKSELSSASLYLLCRYDKLPKSYFFNMRTKDFVENVCPLCLALL